jgi:predicted regulator of Ras-like GTPase activity (Roadblock/LC7/MglB family)
MENNSRLAPQDWDAEPLSWTGPLMSRQISAWQREVRRNPGSAAFARLADRLREDGRLDEATWVCARGLAANPRYSTGRAILGEILHEAGLKTRAKEEFLLGIDSEPHNARARLGLAELLLEQKDAKQALEHLDYILFWQPAHEDARVLARRAQKLLRSSQVEQIISGQEKAVSEPAELKESPPAPPGLVKGREEELAKLLAECPTVAGVMIVDGEGLQVAGELDLKGPKDKAAAGLAKMCATANQHLMKLGLGCLEGGLIEDGKRGVRIYRYQNYAIAVSLKEEAKLGAADVEISQAVERLDRRRKVRAADIQEPNASREAKHA